MFGFSILEPLFTNVLQTKFFKGIYHSVMMKPTPQGGNKPAAPVNDRFIYVGLDDTKGFSCYCRQTGSADVVDVENIGGCGVKKYRLQIPHRLVFFNSNEKRDHEQIIAKCLKGVLKSQFIRLQRVVNIPEEVLRFESPTGRFQFKDTTLYFAIDFFVLLDTQADNCETEFICEGVPNPYCI